MKSVKTLETKDNCVYNGQTYYNKPHGHGCMECPDGFTYQGE